LLIRQLWVFFIPSGEFNQHRYRPFSMEPFGKAFVIM